MRIIAGRHKGRTIIAPAGSTTRPTADRVRVSLFDMLWHAPWGGRHVVDGARALDVFAGTGALGLEALSRGAAHATFLENDAAALAALRQNITRCAELTRAKVLVADALKPPRGQPCSLVFLDPPYGHGLVAAALAALASVGWLAPGAIISAEFAKDDPAELPEGFTALAERGHGAARLVFARAP